MAISNEGFWEALEGWSAKMFLIAGSSLFIHVILVGLIAYAGVSISEGYHALFGLAGLVGALVGLLGFYSRLADDAPRLAIGSVLTITVAGVLFSVILVWLLADILTAGGPQNTAPSWVGVLVPVAIIMITLGFVLTSIASLRTDIPSRPVGYLLLVPVASWIVILVVSVVTNFNAPYALDFFANGVISISWLAIGYSLQTGSAFLEGREVSPHSSR